MLHEVDSLIVTRVTRFLIPFIQLFSCYVIFHGHYSPGGGFQGGALLAASLILQRIVCGKEEGLRTFSTRAALLSGIAGLLVYAGVGTISLFCGGRFLDYAALPGFQWLGLPELRATGILIIEIGVAAAVLGTMVFIYDQLTEKLEV